MVPRNENTFTKKTKNIIEKSRRPGELENVNLCMHVVYSYIDIVSD